MVPYLLLLQLAAQQVAGHELETAKAFLQREGTKTAVDLLGQDTASGIASLAYIGYRRELPIRLGDSTTLTIHLSGAKVTFRL